MMLLEEIRNIKSEKKDLRNFGLVMGAAFGLLAALLWWKGKDTYEIFTVLSACFLFLGLTLPALLTPLQKAWMAFAVVMGWFMTRLILSLLFYVVFTIIGGVPRLFGKKFLDVRLDRSKKSYWSYRDNKPFDKSSYEKQF